MITKKWALREEAYLTSNPRATFNQVCGRVDVVSGFDGPGPAPVAVIGVLKPCRPRGRSAASEGSQGRWHLAHTSHIHIVTVLIVLPRTKTLALRVHNLRSLGSWWWCQLTRTLLEAGRPEVGSDSDLQARRSQKSGR